MEKRSEGEKQTTEGTTGAREDCTSSVCDMLGSRVSRHEERDEGAGLFLTFLLVRCTISYQLIRGLALF